MSTRAVLLGFILGVIVTTLILSGLTFALSPAHAQTTYANPPVACAAYGVEGSRWLVVVRMDGTNEVTPLPH